MILFNSHAVVITHRRKYDSSNKLIRTLKSINNNYTIIIIDDSGLGDSGIDYYNNISDLSELNNVVIKSLSTNVKSLQARKVGAEIASSYGCITIQYIDSGDELIDDNDYINLVDQISNGNYDLGVYPQITNLSNDIYYSKLGTCTKPDRIQKSVLEMSLSCSMCMKVYKLDLVLEAYNNYFIKDLIVFDLDDYYFNCCYAKIAKSLASSYKPHYKYYIDGDSNSEKSDEIIKSRYKESESLLYNNIIPLYEDNYPIDVLKYWMDYRLKTYYSRMSKNYNHVQ